MTEEVVRTIMAEGCDGIKADRFIDLMIAAAEGFERKASRKVAKVDRRGFERGHLIGQAEASRTLAALLKCYQFVKETQPHQEASIRPEADDAERAGRSVTDQHDGGKAGEGMCYGN